MLVQYSGGFNSGVAKTGKPVVLLELCCPRSSRLPGRIEPDQDPATSANRRNGGLDALRAAMTLLVLFHHTAITYGATGGWYYHDLSAGTGLQTKLLTFFCAINQAYFMGLFFLIAGYFTPGSVERHGPWRFLRDRSLRLGVPLLFYGFILGPLTIALAAAARGQPFAGSLFGLWERATFNIGPLWFAEALLIFAGLYLVWHWLTPLRSTRVRPFPSNRTLLEALLATGTAAFVLRLVWPVGTQVSGLQIGYFAGYIVLFVAGCAGASSGWLLAVPDRQRQVWLRVARLSLPMLPVAVWLTPLEDATGGWNIRALAYAFWEPLIAWGFILGLLHVLAIRFRTPGPVWTALARRAYAIYVIHPPVLVAVALAWGGVPAAPLIKFAVTGFAACLICFWIAGLLLRSPAIRRIL